MAESDIFYVKWGADEDGGMEKVAVTIICWAMSIFSLRNLPSETGLEKVLFNATIGMPLRANGHSAVTESYLEWRSWSSTSRKAA